MGAWQQLLLLVLVLVFAPICCHAQHIASACRGSGSGDACCVRVSRTPYCDNNYYYTRGGSCRCVGCTAYETICQICRSFCAPGTYESHPCDGSSGSSGGNRVCTDCPAGKFQPARIPGSECIDCPAGTYQETAGSTECIPCPSGHVQANGGQRCSWDPLLQEAQPALFQEAQSATQEAEETMAAATAVVGPPCVPGDPCSPLQEPGEDGVALVAPSVQAAITLDADVASIGVEGSDSYTSFVDAFEADMASVLGVDVEQVEVTSVEAGSIRCGFAVRPSAVGMPVPPTALASSFSEPGVSLGGIQTAAALAAEDIAQQAAACNSPDVLSTIVNCTRFAVNNAVRIANFTLELQEAVSGAEDVEDVGAIAQGLGAAFFGLRSDFCNSTCAVPLDPQWKMCNQGLYMLAQMQAALRPSVTLLNALTCVEGLPPASAAISGGGIATNVPGTEAIQGDGMVSKLLRLLMLSLVLTLLIFAACFARWGPIPNRFSASKGSEDEVDAEASDNPVFEKDDSNDGEK